MRKKRTGDNRVLVLLTITSTHPNATDLGYLLHKNPGRLHEMELPFGKARVFYPEAAAARCTAAVQVEVDATGLVRGKSTRTLDQYVNDRPYVCSSFLSVALRSLFSTALAGRSKDRPELVQVPLPLELTLSTVKIRGGEETVQRVFAPLGYEIEAAALPLDMPEWGSSRYYEVRLRNRVTLHDALTHLYVLLPVLDEQKHYYVGDEEVEKLMRHGEGWLASHPDKEFIVQRYLQRRRYLVEDAMQQLLAEETADVERTEEAREQAAAQEETLEKPLRLHDQRLEAVAATLEKLNVRKIVDFGCGSGRLIQRLLENQQFGEIAGVDVSHGALEIASRRLKLDRLPPNQQGRVKLLQGSLVYRDSRLTGYDAMAIVEVIEHLDPPRLSALELSVFQAARPRHVIVTTPNREYNSMFPTLPPGRLRHNDHRFEWTRAEFEAWAGATASAHGYTVRFEPLGPVDEALGAPSQMAVFSNAN